MNDFQVESQIQNIRPSYKSLEDVKKLGISEYATIEGLAKEFLISRLKISTILKEGGVWPVGKVAVVDEGGKVKKGRQALAFDVGAAKAEIEKALRKLADDKVPG